MVRCCGCPGRLTWRHLLLFSPPLIVGLIAGVAGFYEVFGRGSFELGLGNADAAGLFQLVFGLLAFLHLSLFSHGALDAVPLLLSSVVAQTTWRSTQ